MEIPTIGEQQFDVVLWQSLLEHPDRHRNISRGGFGSYGDGRIRERKMYIFPNPLTDGDLVGSVSLITEMAGIEADYPSLACVGSKVRRTPAGEEYVFHVYRLRE